MAALSIVEDLKVFEDGVGQLQSSVPAVPIKQLNLHSAPEGLHDGVVEGLPASGRQGVPAGTLSRREIEVLRLVAAGESNAQIARRLGISAYTIERHVVNIYRKIEARGRADATAYALRHGLG